MVLVTTLTFYSLLGVSGVEEEEDINEDAITTFYSLLGVSRVDRVTIKNLVLCFLLPFGSFWFVCYLRFS